MKNCLYTRFSIEIKLIDFERFLDSVTLVGSREFTYHHVIIITKLDKIGIQTNL